MRTKSLKRELRSNIRGSLTLIGLALMAIPLFTTNDHEALTTVQTVVSLGLSFGGFMLLNATWSSRRT